MTRVAFSARNAFTQWDVSIFPVCTLLALICIGTWYLRADWKLASRGRRWRGIRTTSFFGGLVAIEIAIQSPVAVLSNTYFQAHVLQHLLLMVVAPPLLALGAPSTLLLQTAGRRTKERWLRVLRSGPFAVLSHPITAWALYFGVMFGFFLTSLVNVAMWHSDLMDAMNIMFLLGGTLYWWPMVGIDPIIHWRMDFGPRLLNILLGSGVEAFLGVAILNESHPAASMYSLASTHAGGALLWVSTEFASLAAFLPIFIQWGRAEDRVAARSDLRSAGEALERAFPAPSRPAFPPRRLTPWEAEWFARTGSVPTTETRSVPLPGA